VCLPALHRAARLGQEITVLGLIQAGTDSSETDQSGILTARHHAILGGYGQLAQLLAILQRDEVTNLDCAFLLACRNGQTAVARLLLDHGYADATEDNEGHTGLCEAICGNHIETVSLLLEYNINWAELTGHTVLMLAAWSGHPEMFDLIMQQELIRGFDDPGLQDETGRTALHWAVLGGSRAMVEKLLVLNVDPHRTNAAGNTALHLACMEGHCDLIAPLSEAMKTCDAVNHDGLSILMLAAMHGNTDTCKQILQRGLVDPNIQGVSGNTALHRLAGYAGSGDIQFFSEYKADLDIRNKKGETGLICCIQQGNPDAALALITLGCDVNSVNTQGQTAMHLLARYHMDTLVAPLVDAGADINIFDGQGISPLMQAVLDDSLDLVSALTDELAEIEITNSDGQSAITLAHDLDRHAMESLLRECLAEQSLPQES